MEELLSLKWNNHKNSFIQLLTLLRKKNTYTDVTLACAGQLYNVHKIVLSACSDYFSDIFESISCSNPVIVLKDMSAANLESLLDYMYLGEVSVRQSDLSSLILAAECLKMKGLAVPETSAPHNSNNNKRSGDSLQTPRKKLQKPTMKDNSPYHFKPSVKENLYEESEIDSQPSMDVSKLLKAEDSSNDMVTIKEESPISEDYATAWNFTPDVTNDPLNCDQNQDSDANNSYYDSIPFSSDSYMEGENSNSETISNIDNLVLATSSQKQGNKSVGPDKLSGMKCCPVCNKTFTDYSNLKRHIRIHTGEKPFSCPHCPYKANQKSSVTSHIWLRHRDICSYNHQV